MISGFLFSYLGTSGNMTSSSGIILWLLFTLVIFGNLTFRKSFLLKPFTTYMLSYYM